MKKKCIRCSAGTDFQLVLYLGYQQQSLADYDPAIDENI
jgi:hypothetical protein